MFHPFKQFLPFLVSATEAGQNHLSEAAGAVQFGLTLGPLDGALQPPVQETLQGRREKCKFKRSVEKNINKRAFMKEE